ncbi:MarR family winged helix-turn-helix transcriptional regulator [Novosphingobium album (ex Liu et al. 2023)]|uniref:MarR family transcriptional regulator n=1 Tax=Novosphingobium album (ex Liu et al. 2023) TaxID=3031130 RepID=A0ABT5WXR8_9SPHN|nr:MarR family transcriptional regulator [Novosphingobium album (ex Liu et al. 2023)]MDE8654700.1 MarR family transcriptional regulator [Novosphingobium album (ex Liu et al. 2023)]
MVKKTDRPLTDADYLALADFRHAIRRFQAFSETCATEVGLTPQQHQALLAIRAAGASEATVGYVAERLILKPHSATGLVDRLEALGLVTRQAAEHDRRRAHLHLTDRAYQVLSELSGAHRDEIQRLKPLMSAIFKQLEG